VVEALVAATLLGVGMAACVAGLGSLTRAHSRMEDRRLAYRFAHAKFDELVATGEWQTATDGGFETPEAADLRWQASVEPTTVDGLASFRLTVRHATRENSPEASVVGAVRLPEGTEAAP
jgi:hypothetical protein